MDPSCHDGIAGPYTYVEYAFRSSSQDLDPARGRVDMLDIVIIGAGFTGTMIAVHLAQRARAPLHLTLLERSGRFAEGVAYSTRQEPHLLNVPAGRMSAYPQDDRHFVRWALRRDPRVWGGSFVPRMAYAAYLREQLAAAAAPPDVQIVRAGAEARSVSPGAEADRLAVACGDGRVFEADVVVLAIGNYPPADPPCRTPGFYASDRYCRDPWSADALEVDADADLLLLGTGLTMIDVAVSLHARGHRGAIHAVSRRGLLPQYHRESTLASSNLPPPRDVERWPRTARGLLHAVRGAVARGGREGVDWRDVVTSLRSVTPALWMSLPQDERRRFLRHLRPFWETHRHRAAPAVGRTIQQLRDGGRLRVAAGRVLGYEARDRWVRAAVRYRGQDTEHALRVARVINCTGPDTDLARVRDPLVRSLRERGMIRPDALGLGLDSDEDGRVIGASGVPHRRLFLAGPLRRGMLWENVAVPELREEAQRLAMLILDRFTPARSGLRPEAGLHWSEQ